MVYTIKEDAIKDAISLKKEFNKEFAVLELPESFIFSYKFIVVPENNIFRNELDNVVFKTSDKGE